jgi:gliding motility-associated-like protein
MWKAIHPDRYKLAILPLFLTVLQGFAQPALSFTAGEIGMFDILTEPGITSCWKVAEDMDRSKGGETGKVTYLSSKCSSSVKIKWERAGIFFLSVTSYNEFGCSNIKVFVINVTENHTPIANDDYAACNWLQGIRVDLLNNDHDLKNDLDTSSLKILTKAEFGEVTILAGGAINYEPFLSKTGTDRFYYRICDACNQCDTAMVSIKLNDPPLYLPKGISPNGDGVNDRFVIKGLGAFPKSSLTIFSRDGQIIYSNDNYQNDWDGTSNQPNFTKFLVQVGTCYYLLHPGGTNRMIKGFVYVAQ